MSRASRRARWEAAVIKNEDLVCKLGDCLKQIVDLETINSETGQKSYTVAAGQIYKVEGRSGAGWDLVKVTGDGPRELRILNGDILHDFQILPQE